MTHNNINEKFNEYDRKKNYAIIKVLINLKYIDKY